MSAQRTRRRGLGRDAVIRRIPNGTYPPGPSFEGLALAAEFSVSQASVREALREIEVAGPCEIGRDAYHDISRGGNAAGGQRGVRKQVGNYPAYGRAQPAT